VCEQPEQLVVVAQLQVLVLDEEEQQLQVAQQLEPLAVAILMPPRP
jgi:hypothetical protein